MKRSKPLLLLLFVFLTLTLFGQESKDTKTKDVAKLFQKQDILPLKLSYSHKNIKENTKDSTFIQTELSYSEEPGVWKTIPVELRTRGNYRLKNCYFPPVKMKITKNDAKGTLFKGSRSLKIVLPCMLEKNKNDYIIKEYLAYKVYEIVGDYHFKVRLVAIDYNEIKGNKTREHNLKGILIEDPDDMAERYNGKILERNFHPLVMDPISSIQNSFFQYLVGNTDFSTAVQHNEKLMFADKKVIPIPYDFDMSGFVNTSYAVVSQIGDQQLNLSSVRERLYRGFKREQSDIQEVRDKYLSHKNDIFDLIQSMENDFEDNKSFESTIKYVNDFFDVLQDESKFNREIINKLRDK
ncbi:hypothetical protein [Namhaeicola litoreus]|uniref:Uncharacterized protein n=1 Tax=Namhaeicola litoreus TaxID=1052145 RepID=A0ABW3XZI4_9FLAO